MTKAYSCVGEQQFHAYPILDGLRKSKDYVNQFGKLLTTTVGEYSSLIKSNRKACRGRPYLPQ